VNHQAVVAEGPSQISALGVHLLADESVFGCEEIVGEGILVEKVSELVRKLLPLVVPHLQQSVFNSKCVVKVLAEIVVGELRGPVLQVFPVE
jgi:hypothetical protein